MEDSAGSIIPFGKHQLIPPVLFASYRLGDYPGAGLRCFPWDLTETEAILINAYDFKRAKFRELINDGWCPSTHLQFTDKPILIDSGAYYFLKHARISVTPQEVLDIQLKSHAEVGVVLDHPFPPEAVDKKERIDTTIKNTELMIKALQKKQEMAEKEGRQIDMKLMYAVHGHTRKEIQRCLSRLKRKADDLYHVGIGSLAPLARGGNARLAAEIILLVRKNLPKAHLHCFSMGSGLLMLLAFYCGADTVDSQSWIVSAGFKLAQLPGHYVVRMAEREYDDNESFQRSMTRFAQRLNSLIAEENFYVKDWVIGARLNLASERECLDYVDTLVDTHSNENVHNRACHNLWTYNFEVKQAKKAIQEDHFEEFVEKRLTNTRYKVPFEYAKENKKRFR